MTHNWQNEMYEILQIHVNNTMLQDIRRIIVANENFFTTSLA